MTDRELLELAAKAAGIKWDADREAWDAGSWRRPWNPLTDGGDALRLAVKLGISVSYSHSTRLDVPYPTIVEVGAFAGWSPTYTESNAENWFVATRRAIVRATAAIGKYTP